MTAGAILCPPQSLLRHRVISVVESLSARQLCKTAALAPRIIGFVLFAHPCLALARGPHFLLFPSPRLRGAVFHRSARDGHALVIPVACRPLSSAFSSPLLKKKNLKKRTVIIIVYHAVAAPYIQDKLFLQAVSFLIFTGQILFCEMSS